MKKLSIIIIIAVMAIIIIAFTFVYFVSGVSSVIPPIRTYLYKGNVNSFVSDLREYVSHNSNINYTITDTVGNKEDGYAIHVNIQAKIDRDSVEYILKCKDFNSSDNVTSIMLVEAYNKTKISGGYSKDAKGVDRLVSEFDTSIVRHISGIKIR